MAVESIGTTVWYGSGTTAASPGTWTQVEQVLEVEPPQEEASDLDNSHLSTGVHRTFQAGMSDPGEWSLTIHHEAEQTGDLRGFYRVLKPWKVQLSDGTTLIFLSYLKSRGIDTIEVDGLIGVPFTGKVSGEVLYTEGSGS